MIKEYDGSFINYKTLYNIKHLIQKNKRRIVEFIKGNN